MHPLLRELVRLAPHLRLLDGEAFRKGDAKLIQEPQCLLFVVLHELLVDYPKRLYVAPFEVGLPCRVVLVDAQLEMVHGGEAEAQPLPATIFFGVPAPLLGLERLPERDRLTSSVFAADPDEMLQV